MELCAAITAFLADRSRRCNPRTVEWYGTFLRLFGAWCAEHDVVTVCDITPQVLADYVEYLKHRPLQNRRTGGLSPVSVHKLSKALRTFLLWLEREHIAGAPPPASLPIPSVGKRIPKALPVAQARRLLSAPMSKRDRAMIALMLDAGPRAAVYLAVRHAARRVGIDARPHVLRHTFATLALDNDAPITDIQQQLGHESVGTTMIYLSVSRSGLRRRHETYSPVTRLRAG